MNGFGAHDFHLFDNPSTDMTQMVQDPVITGYMMNVNKGVKPLRRKWIALVGAAILVALVALVALYEGKADFDGMQGGFFKHLTADAGTQVQVHQLDAYFRDGWYYYDVTYTSAEGEAIRQVYCGRDGIDRVFDPQVLGQSLLSSDRSLYNLYSLAVEKGEHLSYTPAQIESGLKAAAG